MPGMVMRPSKYLLRVGVLACLAVFVECAGDMVAMKVLHDLPTSSYSSQQHLDTRSEERLVLRMKPANFSGPQHLKEWLGQCFKYRDSKYEYMLCPFKNITQEDIQSYYDPYRGVLGVWLDWDIEDNKFHAMNMVEGGPCVNATYRSTKVILTCGKEMELVSVTEPEKCRYLAELVSPDVCGVNAVTVYPRLSEPLQARWDAAATDHALNYTTDMGYEKELERIFIEAGLVVHPETRFALMQKASVESSQNCQRDLQAMHLRVIQLEEELRIKEEIIRELHVGRNDME